ncbi:Regulatory protein RecX [Flavobacterium indicum GPTSA100-9 = DSM 17447]|uniref:Regulatory protein RecX n=2 Tax=Flavobacterium TaxID=237 RepID=H8XRY6_FLAIG|nr:Regulatory protein RecX [Flavobacterium indicum GPTSA100-9 = DSM 17447]
MKKQQNKSYSIDEIRSKMEYFCSYQDRCYQEVEEKLKNFNLIPAAKEQVMIFLIENNYINEERFAKSFARGKHNYKSWGKVRISLELKFRGISKKNIELALAEISTENYFNHFHQLAEKHWESCKERKGPKKNKKFVDFLLRKGYESHLVYDKLQELNQ